jgi:hypothetical protein
MEVIDKILNEWSFRCHDGIVDINDPKKKIILEEILKELNIDEVDLNEVGDDNYDKVIKNALKVEEIPQVQGSYELGNNVNVNGDDASTFKKLYTVSPPKKGKDIDSAGSKGTGNGEISLYWLFAHQPNHSAKGTQGGGKPDLEIDGKGVEVKSYDSPRIGLGRFGSDKNNIDLLNTLFGLDSLVSNLEGEKNDKKASSLNFSKVDITRAFNTLRDFSNNEDLRDLSSKYPLINNIYNKVDNLLNQLGVDSSFTSEDISSDLIKRILIKKFSEKPRFGGYIANIGENGSINYIEITEEKIKSLDSIKILENTFINQGSIIINAEELFK